jgi:hypothetical protein
MDAKIATEEGTFTAENAEIAENIRTIGLVDGRKKSSGCFAPSRYNTAAIAGVDSPMGSRMILIFLLAPAMLAGAADLKVTTIRSAPRGARLVVDRGEVLPPSKETIYVHEKAQREEFVGYVEAPLNHGGGPAPHMAVITHCDTGVVDQLDLDAHEYREVRMERYPDKKQYTRKLEQAQKDDQKHALFSTVDTGETQDFHGLAARHLITTITGKDKEVGYEKVIDGWYLSLPEAGCAPEYVRQHHSYMETSTAIKEVGSGSPMLPGLVNSGTVRSTLVYNWFLPPGLAIEQKSTQSQRIRVDGALRDNKFQMEKKVLDFSEDPLDPALFEVPADFKKVRELYQHRKTGH